MVCLSFVPVLSLSLIVDISVRYASFTSWKEKKTAWWNFTSQKIRVLIKPQSNEKGIKTTWVQSYTSNKAIRSKGKSSVPKLLAGFCLPTAPSPSMLLDPSSWHRSRNEQCIDLFLWFLLSNKTNTHDKMHYCILIHASLFSTTPVSKQLLNTC